LSDRIDDHKLQDNSVKRQAESKCETVSLNKSETKICSTRNIAGMESWYTIYNRTDLSAVFDQCRSRQVQVRISLFSSIQLLHRSNKLVSVQTLT
jgi:hypothetical protein